MSKMSQLHAELTEQAIELGFESLEEAEANGYTINYCEGRLVKHECCELARQQELAHEAWLAEREEIITELENLITAYAGAEGVAKPVRKAIEFIKKGEC